MKKAKRFVIQELVPPHVYEKRGELAWEIIDSSSIDLIDKLAEKFGTVYINTWHFSRQPFNDVFYWSGLRTFEYLIKDFYSHYLSGDELIINRKQPDEIPFEDFQSAHKRSIKYFSQHFYGRAFDMKFMKVSAEDVRQYINAHPEEFPELMSMELATSWFHGDTRNCVRIKTYTP